MEGSPDGRNQAAGKDRSVFALEVSAHWRYGIAFLLVLIALALWLVLYPVLGERGEFLMFILPVLAAARLAGRGPGLLATAGSALSVWYFFIPPRFSFGIRNFRDVWSLALFAVSGACISLWIGSKPSSPFAAAGSDRSDIAGRGLTYPSFLRRAVLLGGVFLFLAVMIGLLYRDFEHEHQQQSLVDHTYQVLNATNLMLSTLQDAETGQRGYLLTGDERYLEPFRTAIASEEASRETLRKLTADSPSLQARMNDVDRLTTDKIAALNRTIALRRMGRAEDALSVVRTGEGKRIMDEFRAVVAAMRADERDLLARHTAEADIDASRTRWVIGLGGGTLLTLLLFAGAVIERDILKRERAHQALIESEQTTQSLLEAASLAVVGIDVAGRIVLVNATTERIFGYTREELVGKTLESLVPEDLRQRHQVHRANYAFSPHTRPMGEGLVLSCCRKDGSTFPGDIGLCMVHTRTGPLAVSFITDITPRKLAELERERMLEEQRRTAVALRASEEQLQRLNAELEQRVLDRTAQLEASNKELEGFAYSVAHDLRAPLRGIDGWSMALLEDIGPQLDDEARHYLGRVRSEAQRMGRLIDDLLRLSRIARAPLEIDRVDLTALARSIADSLREIHAGRQIEFAIQPGLTASGDAGLLQIALTNLLNNAAKFTGKQAVARIEFGRTGNGGQPAFYVRDNGAGFDMAHASSLFGPFQRLHRASEFPGNGIGLATAHRIIHRHGGRVWAEAQVDRGATFYFTLGVTH